MRSIFTFSVIVSLIATVSAKPKPVKGAAAKKSSSVAAAPVASPTSNTTGSAGGSIGGVAAVEDINHWCMFMPPKPGGDISLNEIDAIPFCTQPMADAPTAQIFPEGFITAAHFVKTATYVQVTGLLNISAYNLSPKDNGGQYDTKSPVGAICHGYTSFVNLIEPSTFDFCIRCCNDNNCPVGRSSAGCYRIVQGSYDPMTPVYSPVLDPTNTTNVTSAPTSTPYASSSALAPLFTTKVAGANAIAGNSSVPSVTVADATSSATGSVVPSNGVSRFAVPASVAAMAMFAAVAVLL